MVAGLILFYWLFVIAFYVLNGIAFMNLAKIAGRSDIAWMAWVPIANVVQKLLLIRKNGAWVLMIFVPIANIIFIIIWQVQLLNAFGKSGAWVLMYIFLSPVYGIMWIVWGFSDQTEYVLPEVNNTNTASF